MTFFNPTEPIVRRKQTALDIQDRLGAWHINLKFGKIRLFSTVYTPIDQVFLIWGLLTLVMFMVGQWLPISWATQAIVWSVLTIIGTGSMIGLTLFWARVESLVWLIHCWAGLMGIGIILTNMGIFWHWGVVLMYLCPIWLGLSALGYGLTSFALRSRTFLGMALIHLASIGVLPTVAAWQFLATGLIMGGSLLLLAQVQWDMRPPIEYVFLTESQKVFNAQQHQMRQKSL
jgi:hypothetical protein